MSANDITFPTTMDSKDNTCSNTTYPKQELTEAELEDQYYMDPRAWTSMEEWQKFMDFCEVANKCRSKW